jgi:uncharacterized protein
MNKFIKCSLVFIFALVFFLFASCGVYSTKSEVSQGTVKETIEETTAESASTTETEEQSTQETLYGYPIPTSYINDFANVIEPEYMEKIAKLIKDLEKETSAEVMVVTVETLHGESIDKYALELFDTWSIGNKDKNNGILFLIDTQERKLRILAGQNFDDVITKEVALKILEEKTLGLIEGKVGLASYECVIAIAAKIMLANE